MENRRRLGISQRFGRNGNKDRLSMAEKMAFVDENVCVACGVCVKACPKEAIRVIVIK